MQNFTEWCKTKGYLVEATTKDPIKSGKKFPSKEKTSGKVRDLRDDLSKDYKGNWKKNGTVDPFKVPGAKGKAKKVADIAGS